MQRCVLGSLCFLTCLLYNCAKAEEVTNSQDLSKFKPVTSGNFDESNADDGERSGASSSASANSFDQGSSAANAQAESISGSGSNTAEAESEALSNSNVWQELSSQAKANAEALSSNAPGLFQVSGVTPTNMFGMDPNKNSASNIPYGSGYIVDPNSNSNQATLDNSNIGRYVSPSFPYNSGAASQSIAQAQANAQAQSQASLERLNPGYYNPNIQRLVDSSSLQASDSQSSAIARPSQSLPAGSNAQADASASSIASGVFPQNFPSGSDWAGPKARLISYNEYILPSEIPGAENALTCSRMGELHYFRPTPYQCLVCACIEKYGQIVPICVNCNGCQSNDLIPAPVPVPVTVRPIPEIEPEVSCNPLPTNRPFQNPLNPCQNCVCRRSVDNFGKPDVQIVCVQNPLCVIPEESTILPPIPVPSEPIPLPMCERFPQNVWFPHPSDMCLACKCSLGTTAYGGVEPQITCYPKPNCEPVTPEIRPVPVIEPTPFPEIVTPKYDPIPWPPIVHPTEPKGPLPGPSPHESCKPFPPNQKFQHPWDTCQVCVCTESHSPGRVNVEVNCYTKKECCIEIPTLKPPVPQPIPPVPHNPGQLQIQDSICKFKSFGVEFVDPKDSCRVCTCELFGNLVFPVCRRVNSAECFITTPERQNYYPRGSISNAEANAIANSQGMITNPHAHNQASAKTIAQSQTGQYIRPLYPSGQVLPNRPINSGSQIYPNGFIMPGKSSGTAEAQAKSQASNGYPTNMISNQYSPYNQHENLPESMIANIIPSSQDYPHNIAETTAKYIALNKLNNNNMYPGYGYYNPNIGSSFPEHQSQAEATANAQSHYNNINPGDVSNSQANAQAIASSNSIASSNLYPNLYPNHGATMTPSQYPGQYFNYGSPAQAQSNAHAQASAQGNGTASSQAQSSASSGGGFAFKSGNPEEDEARQKQFYSYK